MSKIVKNSRAVLVFEGPWNLDEYDQNRSSVLPFVDGFAKHIHNVEVFYTRFYDLNSFKLALKELTQVKFDNTVVYISAHGWKRKIGNAKLISILKEVGECAGYCNITGIMLGSCFVGENINLMQYALQGTNLRWCAGYSSVTHWLPGTMIDISILNQMLRMDEDDFSNEKNLINSFGLALSPFSQNYIIGENYNKVPVPLHQSISIAIQPRGQGKRPRDISNQTLETWTESQWLDEEELEYELEY